MTTPGRHGSADDAWSRKMIFTRPPCGHEARTDATTIRPINTVHGAYQMSPDVSASQKSYTVHSLFLGAASITLDIQVMCETIIQATCNNRDDGALQWGMCADGFCWVAKTANLASASLMSTVLFALVVYRC